MENKLVVTVGEEKGRGNIGKKNLIVNVTSSLF